MLKLILPSGIHKEKITEDYARYIFAPLDRGYGTTVGNILRRILLSSIRGAAIVAVRIEKVLHEFSTIPGVLEDVPKILLNLRQVRFRITSGDSLATVKLRAEGTGKITAKQLQLPDNVELHTPDVHIATLTTKSANLNADIYVASGRGYVPHEEFLPEFKQSLPIHSGGGNIIYVDALFSPVQKVNFSVENIRVDAMMDKEKLIMEIWTDKTVTPDEALNETVGILRELVERLLIEVREPYSPKRAISIERRERIKILLSRPVEDLELSKRTLNALHTLGISTIAQLVHFTREELLDMEPIGEKLVNELDDRLHSFGISFGMKTEEFLPERGFHG